MEHTTKERRGRAWGIVAVTLGVIGFLGVFVGMHHPLLIVAFLSIPAAVICGGIAFHRGAERLGGTAICLGTIGFLLQSIFLSFHMLVYKADAKADLIRSLNRLSWKRVEEGRDGVPLFTDDHYLYSYNEEETQTTSALTFKITIKPFAIGRMASGTPLRFTRIEDKKSNTSKTYGSKITKEGDSYALVVTDVINNEVIQRKLLPTARSACEPAAQFDSNVACTDDFKRIHNGVLQYEANRTCDNQFAVLTCCLKDGSKHSVHLIIPPDNRRCQLKDLVPNVELLTERP